ncbi:MAG: MAPEG family protein [Sphingomonas sp.]
MIELSLTILKPVAILVGWSLLMMVWMLATRIPAMKAAGVDLGKLTGGKGTDADGVLPDRAQWKAHNYNHLMEQPTLFYAIAITLALIGQGGGLNAEIAWAYVGFRVLHSIVQATWNRVSIRFLLFLLSSLALVALTLHALIALFAIH